MVGTLNLYISMGISNFLQLHSTRKACCDHQPQIKLIDRTLSFAKYKTRF